MKGLTKNQSEIIKSHISEEYQKLARKIVQFVNNCDIGGLYHFPNEVWITEIYFETISVRELISNSDIIFDFSYNVQERYTIKIRRPNKDKSLRCEDFLMALRMFTN